MQPKDSTRTSEPLSERKSLAEPEDEDNKKDGNRGRDKGVRPSSFPAFCTLLMLK